MAEEPMELSAAELPRVEILKYRLDLCHERWNFALWDFLIRPVTTCQNFDREIDPVND